MILNENISSRFLFISHQSFVSSGTNLNLHFAKGEDGVVPKEYLDFDKEPGKVSFCQEHTALSPFYNALVAIQKVGDSARDALM